MAFYPIVALHTLVRVEEIFLLIFFSFWIFSSVDIFYDPTQHSALNIRKKRQNRSRTDVNHLSDCIVWWERARKKKEFSRRASKNINPSYRRCWTSCTSSRTQQTRSAACYYEYEMNSQPAAVWGWQRDLLQCHAGGKIKSVNCEMNRRLTYGIHKRGTNGRREGERKWQTPATVENSFKFTVCILAVIRVFIFILFCSFDLTSHRVECLYCPEKKEQGEISL